MTEEEIYGKYPHLKDQRFDIVYRDGGAGLDYHFCRDWDEDGGCYGTNKNHGYSFLDAVKEVADHYENKSKSYRELTNHNLTYFLEQWEDVNGEEE